MNLTSIYRATSNKNVAFRLTHALEFLLELNHVLAVGNAKIVVRVSAMHDAIGRIGGADGQDGCRAFCPLRPANLINTHHACL